MEKQLSAAMRAQLWNQLPDDVKGTPSVASFKSGLKTLFLDAF